MQTCVLVQVTPHAPQLASSKRRSTQEVPQAVRPVWQPQLPDRQVSCPRQTFPQRPQFWLLLDVLTHWAPQEVRPKGQVHTPATHCRPKAQVVPQVPQLALSFCRSRQMPEQ